ncbi:hypothetical protein ABMA28_005388 [Loxostege sticticalis]|uniref:EF-hand domain-containing protein n=1 Tax=Loxostege sticticalis TaxID=481309 RepID=A0ABD0SQ85_LOXSC
MTSTTMGTSTPTTSSAWRCGRACWKAKATAAPPACRNTSTSCSVCGRRSRSWPTSTRFRTMSVTHTYYTHRLAYAFDGMITVEEFKQAVKNSCVGRKYEEFPQAMKAFIESNFRMIDINSDGVIGIEEYRYDCVQRMVLEDIKVIDDAFDTLLNDDDRRKGGLTLSRYQELFAQFLGDNSDDCPAKHLFGPLEL